LVSGLILTSTGFAQDAAEAEDEVVTLSEFEVTDDSVKGWVSTETISGMRAAEKLIDVPQHINIATRGFIDDLSSIDTATAVAYTSGSTANKSRWADDYYIRGSRVTFTGLDGFANVEKTITPPYMVERIEVIKGPASILYGGASQTGGTINRVLKTPKREEAGEIRMEIGTDDWYSAMFDVTGPLSGNENVQFRFIGEWREAGGTRFDIEQDDQIVLSPSIAVDIGNRSRVTLRYRYFDRKFHNARLILDPDVFPKVEHFPGVAWNSPDSDPHRSNESHNLFFEFTSAITDTIAMRFAYLGQRAERPTLRAVGNVGQSANGNTTDRIESPAGGLTWNVTRSHQEQVHNDEFDGWQLDFTMKNKVFNNNSTSRLTTGVEHSYNALDFTFLLPLSNMPWDLKAPTYPEQEPGAQFTDFWRYFRYEERSTNFTGAYVNETLTFADGRVGITGGLRYNYTHASTFRRWQGGPEIIDPVTGVVDKSNPSINRSPGDTSAVWTSRWGFTFKPFNEYRGFSIFGGFNERFSPASGADFDGNLFGPERSENLEFGVKMDFFGGFSGTISYFDLTIAGAKEKDPLNFGFDRQVDVTSSGFDMSLSFVRSGFSSIVTYYQGTVLNGTTGDQLSSAPDETFSFFTKYDFSKGEDTGLTIGGGGKYQAAAPSNRAYGPDGSRIFQPSSMDFDVFASYAWEKWKVQLNVSNLTDEEIWGEMFSATNSVITDARRIKFTVFYRW